MITMFFLYDIKMGEAPLSETYSRVLSAIKVWQTENITNHKFLYFGFSEENPYASMGYFSGIFFILYQIFFNEIFFLNGVWSILFLSYSGWFLTNFYILDPCHENLVIRILLIFTLINFLFFTSATVIAGSSVNHDSFHILLGIASFIIGFWQYCSQNVNKITIALAFLVLIMFGHISGLTIFLALYFFRPTNLLTKYILLVSIALLLFNILFPYIISESPTGSSFFFRSGLDGDRQYFTNHIQAIFVPFQNELPYRLQTALAPVIIVLFSSILYWSHRTKSRLIKSVKIFGFSSIGYLSFAIVFPQSVSIHPYLYDFQWIVPLYLTTGWFLGAPLSEINFRRLNGKDLAFVVIIVYLIFANLLGMSEAAHRFLDLYESNLG